MATDLPYVPDECCVVCSHVFSRRLPVLRAIRGSSRDRNPDLPEAEYDGCWQVTCGVHDHATEVWGREAHNAKLIALKEVKEFEPSLEPFLSIPPGYQATRQSVEAPWIVAEIPERE